MDNVIEKYIDKNGNRWETRIKLDFAGNRYKVLYLNGKKYEILGRIWQHAN